MILRMIILRLLDSYFRHRWLYFLPAILLMGAGVFFVLNATPEYHARGVLYVQTSSLLTSLTGMGDSSGNWWATPVQLTQNELNELLQTDAFVRAVIRPTPLEQEMDQGPVAIQELMDEVRGGIWIQPLGDNQLAVNVFHEDPQVAYQLINSLIDTYLTWQVNAERSESEVAQQFFGNLIEQYQAQIEEAHAAMQTYLQAHPAPVRGERSEVERLEIARLQANIDLAAQRLTSAIDNEEESRLALAQIESNVRQSHFLIDAPTLPDEPTTSLRDTAIDIAIFVAVGIGLSLGAIAGGALLDRTFRFSIDVESRLDLPVLAIVPDVAKEKGGLARFRRRGRKMDDERDEEWNTGATRPPHRSADNGVNGEHHGLNGSEPEVAETEAELEPVQ